MAIDHVLNPRQRVPVAGVAGSKCPPEIVESQTIIDVLIFGYIYVVVISQKLIALHPPVCNNCGQNQNQINPNQPIIFRICHTSKLPDMILLAFIVETSLIANVRQQNSCLLKDASDINLMSS